MDGVINTKMNLPRWIPWTPSPSPSKPLVITTTNNNSSSVHCDVPMSTSDDRLLLTWKDLWVTVKAGGGKGDNGGGSQRPILEGVSGYAGPGQVLAIMGPSGCGKSTILDALAGRLGSNTRQRGEILLNGREQALAFGTSAYVTEDDTLMTTLTVKEAVCFSAELQLPDSMSRSQKIARANEAIKDMGLQGCANTRIGGWNIKGLSGGQKRRVSICIETLTKPRLLFLDEPTSGLDSAASYHVMRRIIKLAKQEHRTIVASIHHPSSEVFELFHNLCLLSCGKLVYFGSTSTANEFFTSNGFPCPSMRNPSDHYLRTINKDFEVDDIEQGLDEKQSTEESINSLVYSYKSSQIYEEVQQHIIMICKLQVPRGKKVICSIGRVASRESSTKTPKTVGFQSLPIVVVGIEHGFSLPSVVTITASQQQSILNLLIQLFTNLNKCNEVCLLSLNFAQSLMHTE